MKYRRDFCDDCVFIIDFFIVRDLDDVVYCKKFVDDFFEVGVYIVDVSFFVCLRIVLDEVVVERVIFIYMV